MAIRNWDVVIGGLTQGFGDRTGLHDLWLRLGARYRGPETCVEWREWNSNWSELAEAIKIARNYGEPIICVYAYSYGAGWGTIRFAQELRRRGLSIHYAVLSDAVYRSQWLSFTWRSLIGSPQILVPSNVRKVRWFYQRRPFWVRVGEAIRNHTLENMPCGHPVVAEDSEATVVFEGTELKGLGHASMDEAPQFHRWCETVAESAHKAA